MNTENGKRREDEKVLTPTEVEGLQRELDENAADAKETDMTFSPNKQYSGETNAVMRRYRRVLERGKPGSLSKNEKIRLERQIKMDREWLQRNMVPRSHAMLRAGPDPAFRKAVNFMAQKEMSREFQKVAERYKNNARKLWPDSPEMANLETIRPEAN